MIVQIKMKLFLVLFLCVYSISAVPKQFQNRGARIIGGQLARPAQFPFSAAIYVTTEDGQFFCGGALLNSEWIVTAAFCADGATLFNIRLGLTNLRAIDDPNGLILATDSYTVHPDYDPVTLENNIALIQLRLPITYSIYIRPVDYLPVGDTAPYTGTIGIGWGQTSDSQEGLTDDLQWVPLTVLSNEECRDTFGSQITNNMICVDGNYNEGTCYGDNGGPLVQEIGRGYLMQVGVSTFISGNGCESTDPSGYTRMLPYVGWINNITGL